MLQFALFFLDLVIIRFSKYQTKKKEIEQNEGGLDKFAQGIQWYFNPLAFPNHPSMFFSYFCVAFLMVGYKIFGFNRVVGSDGQRGILYKEWAPGANRLFLVGDFSTLYFNPCANT